MKIKKFEVAAPDSDGEMYAEIAFSLSNPTKDEVRWVQFNTVYLNKDGFALNGTNDHDELCMLAPGDDFECSTSDRVRVALAGPARNDVTAIVHVTLYAREFFKLGEIDVPAVARGVATMEKAISSQVIEGPVKLSVYREPEDSEGRCGLEIKSALTSQINVPIGRTELKLVLLDSEESTIEENSETTAWRSRSGGLIAGSFSYMRKAQLRGAKLRATLAVFREVHAATITAKSTPSKD
jgi:hypothetical protein